MKNKKNIIVFDSDIDYDIPTNPEEFIAFFKERISLVPEGHKDTTNIGLEVQRGYEDSTSLRLTISHTRDETDEEEQDRLERERNKNENNEKKLRLQYEQLKAKFEGTD